MSWNALKGFGIFTILYFSQVSMSWQKLTCPVMQNRGEFTCSVFYDVHRDSDMKPSSSAYISRVYLFIFLVSLSVTSIDWSSSSLLLGAAYVLWYLNKNLPLLFLFDPWIYISFFYLHGFTFQLKMIHTCQHISNCVIWFRRPNTSNCYDICLFSALETFVRKF